MLILTKKYYSALVATILFSVFILPLNEHLAFMAPTDRRSLAIAAGLKLLFAVFFYLLAYFVLHFIERLRARDPLYRAWLKYALIYLGAMTIVFLLIYPGHWVHDEFNILEAVKVYGTDYAWQHFFTNIFYTFCMYLIPTGVAINIVQMIFASFVLGYVTSHAREHIKNKRLVYLLYVPFFFFPVLLNNFYPLRATMYSYIELLLIAKLIFTYLGQYKQANKYVEFTKFTVLVTLLGLWRTEGVYYFLLLPVLAVWFGLFSRRVFKQAGLYVTLLVCALIVGVGYGITKATSSTKYELTAMINPLSTMLQSDLKGDNIEGRLAIMDKAVDLDMVRQAPSYTEIPSFWNGAVRDDYQAHLSEFKEQYLYLVAHNPDLFLDNRTQTLLATNSFGKIPAATLGRLGEKYREDTLASNFVRTNFFAKPWNPDLKTKISSLLLTTQHDGTYSVIGHIFWNSIIPIVLLLVIGLRCLMRRQWAWIGFIALVLLRAPLVFLTAPANYFFYYLPVYMVGYFLVFWHLMIYLDKRHQLKSSITGKR